eukprot:jgi/Bigna1/131342/aug1.14_g6050
MVDYSRFDQLSKQLDEEEVQEKQKRRNESMQRYYKEQKLKQEEWEARHGHKDGHGHAHGGHSCGHGHGAEGAGDRSSRSKQPPKKRSGCMGCVAASADPSALQEMIEESKRIEKEPKEPEMTIEEKNTKKIKAVEATRIDASGKKFFQKGDYRTALQIYNRGALICNGIYDLSDELWTVVQEHEVVLDVNIATCHLKLKEYQEAIERCKMALAIDKKHVKAHYRMAQANLELLEFENAEKSLEKARECGLQTKTLSVMRKKITAARKEQRKIMRNFQQKMVPSSFPILTQ